MSHLNHCGRILANLSLQNYLISATLEGFSKFSKFMVSSIAADPEAVQTITLPPPCLTAGMMFFFLKCCVSFTPDVTVHIFTESMPISLVDHQDVSWQMREPFCSFGAAMVLSLELSHEAIFAQSLCLIV
ncbi:hypothetical protein ATANTOWER_011850 [Ataeniobius toweri]|uniref:Uncharacterized protein n=1 Tax=Ataeniobius toweri TaxID=208326 RepID=A0ABU7BY54_9TELE|nr:hypothetical protein [Ataeniobius toweri]